MADKAHRGEAELANALSHGDSDAEQRARKVLAAAGLERAASKRKAAAEESDVEQARTETPVKRTAPAKHQAKAD